MAKRKKQTSKSKRTSKNPATAHLEFALEQLLGKLDKSKGDLLKADVLATIDRAVAW